MTPTISSLAFRSMGSDCEVTVVGDRAARLAERAPERAEVLESRWSRFRSESELSLLNAGRGEERRVSADTYLLIEHGVAAQRMTGGRFDPTVLAAVVASGYDRSFTDLAASISECRPTKAPGCVGIELDEATRSVRLPMGVGIDPGGYGKGLAADLISEMLIDSGARGACVNMGGDLRCSGEPPPGGWRIGIANPILPDDLLCVVELEDQGMATSSRLIRRWRTGTTERHHLLVPRTGKPSTGLLAATMIAGQAWWAEVLTKVAMIDRRSTRHVLGLLGGEGLFVDADATVSHSPNWPSFAVASPGPALV